MAHVKEGPPPKMEVIKGPSRTPEAAQRPMMPWFEEMAPPPFMRRFAEEMERMYEDFGLRLPSLFGRGREFFRRGLGQIPAVWSPRIDVREKEGMLCVRADLPGMTKEEVKVEIAGEQLVIQGERKQEKEEKREGCLYSEFSFGSFYRAIPIPEGVDTSQVTAEFQNGVLEIRMPAPPHPAPKARRVEIQEPK